MSETTLWRAAVLTALAGGLITLAACIAGVLSLREVISGAWAGALFPIGIGIEVVALLMAIVGAFGAWRADPRQ